MSKMSMFLVASITVSTIYSIPEMSDKAVEELEHNHPKIYSALRVNDLRNNYIISGSLNDELPEFVDDLGFNPEIPNEHLYAVTGSIFDENS